MKNEDLKELTRIMLDFLKPFEFADEQNAITIALHVGIHTGIKEAINILQNYFNKENI
jgi:hypothetical protein